MQLPAQPGSMEDTSVRENWEQTRHETGQNNMLAVQIYQEHNNPDTAL